MVEVLRENWEFILYERKGALFLFIVNGHGSLSEVTYKLDYLDKKAFEEQGMKFLIQKVKDLRCCLRQAPRLNYSCL